MNIISIARFQVKPKQTFKVNLKFKTVITDCVSQSLSMFLNITFAKVFGTRWPIVPFVEGGLS